MKHRVNVKLIQALEKLIRDGYIVISTHHRRKRMLLHALPHPKNAKWVVKKEGVYGEGFTQNIYIDGMHFESFYKGRTLHCVVSLSEDKSVNYLVFDDEKTYGQPSSNLSNAVNSYFSNAFLKTLAVPPSASTDGKCVFGIQSDGVQALLRAHLGPLIRSEELRSCYPPEVSLSTRAFKKTTKKPAIQQKDAVFCDDYQSSQLLRKKRQYSALTSSDESFTSSATKAQKTDDVDLGIAYAVQYLTDVFCKPN